MLGFPNLSIVRIFLQLPVPFLTLIRSSLFFAALFSVSACSNLSAVTAKPVQPIIEQPSVALVLGGGGARGFAHVGVIKALEENGITPTLVVGTSVGSIVGGLYASGYSAAKLEQLALTIADDELMDFTLSNQGFVEGIKLKNFINAQVNQQPIQNFPIRFAAVAAEKDTLKKAVFSAGDAGLAIQASASVPNIFIAPRIPEKVGKKYIDGGAVSLVAVDSARDLGADIVIAVDISSINPNKNPISVSSLPTIGSFNSFWGLFDYNIIANLHSPKSENPASINAETQRADIIITPKVSHISALDTGQRRALMTAGVQAVTPEIIAAIKQRIAQQTLKQP